MRLHGRHQNFLRHVEETFIELAGMDHGPLNKPRILGEQPVIFDKSEPSFGGGIVRAVQDRLRPLFSCDYNLSVQKCRWIVRALRNFDCFWFCGFFATQEAVSEGDIAALDAVHLEFNRLIVEQAEDRMQRPYPADAPRAPAHGLRPGELAHDGGHRLGDDRGGGAAGLFGAGQVIAALRVVDDLAFVEALQPRRAQEPLDRLFRRAHARTLPLLGRRSGLLRHALRDEGDAARPRERVLGRNGEPRLGQGLGHHASEVFSGARLHPRGDFFGEKFEKQIGHGGFSLAQGECRSFRKFAANTSEIPRNLTAASDSAARQASLGRPVP